MQNEKYKNGNLLTGESEESRSSDEYVSAGLVEIQNQIEGTSGEFIEVESLSPVLTGSGVITVEDGVTGASDTIVADVGILSATESHSGLTIFNERARKLTDRHPVRNSD